LLLRPLGPLAESFEGLISIERLESIANPGKVMAIAYWRDAQSMERGRAQPGYPPKDTGQEYR
jgi:heme-degrading monooxygenase HmoA